MNTELIAKLMTICPVNQEGDEKWKLDLNKDIGVILGVADYLISTTNDDIDNDFAQAVIRIVERVKNFEGIK